MKLKIKNIVKIIILTIIMLSLVLVSIVSQNTNHIHSCEADNCYTCSIIRGAQILINLTISIFVFIVSTYLIFFFLASLQEEKLFLSHKTLVLQKVQMNE